VLLNQKRHKEEKYIFLMKKV